MFRRASFFGALALMALAVTAGPAAPTAYGDGTLDDARPNANTGTAIAAAAGTAAAIADFASKLTITTDISMESNINIGVSKENGVEVEATVYNDISISGQSGATFSTRILSLLGLQAGTSDSPSLFTLVQGTHGGDLSIGGDSEYSTGIGAEAGTGMPPSVAAEAHAEANGESSGVNVTLSDGELSTGTSD